VKKLIPILAGLAVALSLAACGGSTSKTHASGSVAASSSPATTDTPSDTPSASITYSGIDFCTVLKNDTTKLPTAPEFWPALNPLQSLQAYLDQGLTPADTEGVQGLTATASALQADDALAPPQIEPAINTLLTFANGMVFNLTDPVGKSLDVNVVKPAIDKVVSYCKGYRVTISGDPMPAPSTGG
jgi:hypothetical protein